MPDHLGRKKGKNSLDIADKLGWKFLYGVKEPKINADGDGFKFNWTDKVGQVDYLMFDFGGNLGGKIELTFQVKTIKGNPHFKATEGGDQGTFGVMIQREGDTLSGDQAGGNMRFWSSERIVLKDVKDKGKVTVTLDLNDLDEWTNVWGQSAKDNKQQFEKTLSDVGNIGLTFGGGGHYGHGVKVKGGEVKIIVEDFVL